MQIYFHAASGSSVASTGSLETGNFLTDSTQSSKPVKVTTFTGFEAGRDTSVFHPFNSHFPPSLWTLRGRGRRKTTHVPLRSSKEARNKPQLTCDNASLGFVQVTGNHVPHAGWLALDHSPREAPRLARNTKKKKKKDFRSGGRLWSAAGENLSPSATLHAGGEKVTRDAGGKGREGSGSQE